MTSDTVRIAMLLRQNSRDVAAANPFGIVLATAKNRTFPFTKLNAPISLLLPFFIDHRCFKMTVWWPNFVC
jgi:hypothetical protein